MMEEWKPWDIQIDGPPCKRCKFWRPEFRYMIIEKTGDEVPDGVRMCQTTEMYHDFSCFVPRLPLEPRSRVWLDGDWRA